MIFCSCATPGFFVDSTSSSKFLVLVGTVVTMTDEQPLPPNNCVLPSHRRSLHPVGNTHITKEFTNLFKGFTYYLAIPTMYMTLMNYSMCNLHDVSWGTREGSTNQNGENGAAKKGEAEKKTDVCEVRSKSIHHLPWIEHSDAVAAVLSIVAHSP